MLVESDPHGRSFLTLIVDLFELDRWNIADRFEQPSVIEPIHPVKGLELDVFTTTPRPESIDHLGLIQSDHRFGKCIVIGIPNATY